jgi:upstream activation factor subunit UAF30
MPAAKSTNKKESVDTKTKTSKKPEEVVAAPPVSEAKKETKTKAKIPKTESPAPTPVETTQTPEVQNVVVASDIDTSISDNFSEFISKFQGMLSNFSSLKAELKTLERKTMRQIKVVQKINNKKKRKGVRAPSGFVKPSPISDELANFLGKPQGCEMARTDVTREINKYIRANNLQDKQNGRQINPDEQLCKLLKIGDEVVLTYFNLQRYMGPHFPKQIKPLVAPPVANSV